MTECERLIAEGVFKPEFFEEETRCDWLVSTKMKKVWAIEIDLLLQLDKVCRRHGLQYYLIGGTLLGAIRHGGFIPWDDDVDVAMPREDYDRLLSLGQEEWGEPYFLQTPETDPGYYYTFTKVRNSNTTCLNGTLCYAGFNQGILLDIFPIDVCDESDAEEHFETIKKLALDNSTYMRIPNPHLSERDKERVRNYQGGDPYENCLTVTRLATQHEGEKEKFTKRIVACSTVYNYTNNMFNAEDVENVTLHEFEGYKFPIPVGYDAVLKTIYGDYMQFPPLSERGNWHNAYFDPDVPYREVMGKAPGYLGGNHDKV